MSRIQQNLSIATSGSYTIGRTPCLEGCKECSGLDCCGINSQGTFIGPAYLTRYDIRMIEKFTGISRDTFCQTRINPATGNTVFFLKIVNNRCIFLDHCGGLCQIHAIRPIDCRLFPLDIHKINQKFFWVMYNYEFCNLTKMDKIQLLTFKDQALRFLREEIEDYATCDTSGLNKLAMEIICEISVS